MPEVRLVGPAGPGAPARAAPRSRRRLQAAALVAALLLGALALLVRRGPAPVLALDPAPAVYLGVVDLPGGGVQVQVPVRLGVAGTRDVRLLQAGVPGLPLRTDGTPVALGHGGSAQVVLLQDVVCPAAGPPARPGPGDRLVVRVADPVGEHTERLALPREPFASLAREVDQLCGWVPPGEALRAVARPGTVDAAGVLRVPVDLADTGVRPLRVTAVRPALPGLALSLEVDGTPVPALELPGDPRPRPQRDLPPPAPRTAVLRVDLTAGGCPLVRAAPRPAPGTPGVLAVLTVDGGPGTASTEVHPPDLGLALPLLLARCG